MVGLLLCDNTIDVQRLRILRDVSHPMLLTFHRAFDNCLDVDVALQQIIAAGCDRLLTSGHAKSAVQGRDCLHQLVKQAAGKIKIIAAAGICASNAFDLITTTGVSGIHAGSSVMSTRCSVCSDNQLMWTIGRDSARNANEHEHVINSESVDPAFDSWVVVDSTKVDQLSTIASNAWAHIHGQIAP